MNRIDIKQFATSYARLIDLAPTLMVDRQSGYTCASLFPQPRILRTVYLSKRSRPHAYATIAAEADGPPLLEVPTVQELWTQMLETSTCVALSFLPDPYRSVYRDSALLGSFFEAWEESRGGVRLCKGMRVMGRILGQWKESLEIQKYKTESVSLENTRLDGRLEVRVIAESQDLSHHSHCETLSAGSTVVWWMSAIGNYVELLG